MSGTPTTTESSTDKNVKVILAKDKMAASVVIQQPPSGEAPPSVDSIISSLNAAGVVFGINEDLIRSSINEKKYDQPIKIADGTVPEKGHPSTFEYNFETEKSMKPVEDDQGKIDYRAINFIQNAAEGDVLVVKTPPTAGEPGKNILGEEVLGTVGRDIPFKNGKNTKISEDGAKLIATASGAIVILNDKVWVNDITPINGDLDFNVGNINTKGSVRISGNIKAGFSLEIDGDLEVNGNVENSNIKVKGNIFIKGGLIGEGNGKVFADGDITFKFAESQHITAGGSIFAGDEMINCQIKAGNKVELRSKVGKIVGGHIIAQNEVKTAFLGSDAGITTHVTIITETPSEQEITKVNQEIKRLNEDGEKIKKALLGMYKLQMENRLPESQEETLKKLEAFNETLPGNLERLEAHRKLLLEEEEKKEKEKEKKSIIVTNMIYPGVKASFGNVYKEFLDEEGRCEMTLDINHVVISPYTESN